MLRALFLSLTLAGSCLLIGQDRLADGTNFPSWEKPVQFSRTYYVDGKAAQADDNGPGTRERPFRTIGKAAAVLQPGERVIIAEGVYREAVHPARGGTGPDRMISYEAADGAKVVVKGSVILKDGWKPSAGWSARRRGGAEKLAAWQIRLDPGLFEGYNPFGMLNIPQQRWAVFEPSRLPKLDVTGPVEALPSMIPDPLHCGLLFVDGKPAEQVRDYSGLGVESDPGDRFRDIGGGGARFWVEHGGLILHLRLPGNDSPDRHTIETTVREQVFAPIERHLGYIRVKGLRFEHAGNGFPVPQRGLVSTSRGHHWIIENNTIQWANSVGLDVGKEHWSAATPEIPGFHVIRNNIIRYAGICGIAGPLVHNMLVERNLIEYTGWQDAQRMYESAGVKFHNTENLLFRDNVIRHVKSGSGIWLDVGNVNCRLTRNVIADVSTFSGAIHVEGSHEENLIDHNIISGVKKNAWEPGGQAAEGWAIFADGTDNLVIAHNLILNAENAGFRSNPVFSRLVGGRGGTARSHKIYNNIFCGAGRAAVEFATEFNELDGNLYGAMPGGFIRILAPAPPQYLDLAASREFHGWERNGRVAELKATFDPDTLHVTLVTPAELPKVKVYRDLSADYFGKSSGAMRYPGPFADLDRAYGPRNVDPRQK